MILNEDLTIYSLSHAENEARRLVPYRHLFVFLKVIYIYIYIWSKSKEIRLILFFKKRVWSHFLRKKFSCILQTDRHFFVWLPLFLDILGQICVIIISFPTDDAINFEINLSFLIKLFSYMNKKDRTKI